MTWATMTEDERDEARYMADDTQAELEDEEYEPSICPACNGSGEGQYDGTRCSTCKGRGES